jgi:8-oxo-dGTP diphosphatase
MSNIYPALKAIIVKNGKILILKRSEKEDCFKNQWDLPGGRIKFGEDPKEALKREIKEEAGIRVEIIRPVRIWTFFEDRGKTQVVGITMLCKYKSGKVKVGKEHESYRWVKPKEIENYNINEGIKKDIKEAVKNKIFQ